MTTAFDQRGTRAGMVRFDGNVTVFFVAICEQCQMALPFPTEKDRGDYIVEHVKTGHALKLAVDVRPDPIQSEKRKDSLVAALRQKYARPAKTYAGKCTNWDQCRRNIHAGELMVSFAGKFYHAECLDDAHYLRIASITDVLPGIFDKMPAVQHKRWISGDPPPVLHHTPTGITVRGGVLGQMQVPEIFVPPQSDSPPKKMNARERRRQRRKDKQWQKR